MSISVQVENLGFSVDGKSLLEGVSFSIEKGSFCSIIGPNGAGKTTLIKCLNRINHASDGRIAINGRDLESVPQRELARSMGYIPQNDARFSGFSVYEFVMMGRYPYFRPFAAPSEQDHLAVELALEMLNLKEFHYRTVRSLSGGERQKVLIAAAFAQSDDILLLDEPTTFLDPSREAEIAHVLRDLNQQKGTTIISVTHDLNAALRLSSKVILLDQGKIVFSGNPDALIEGSLLDEVYGTTFNRLINPSNNQVILVPEHHQ